MSDLDNAITAINLSASRTNIATNFVDELSTSDENTDVTNANNGKTVGSFSKQIKGFVDAVVPTNAVDALEAAALAAGTTYDNITYSDNLVDEIKGYILDADAQITYAVPEAAQGKFISSVVDGVLTTTDTTEYEMYTTQEIELQKLGDLKGWRVAGDGVNSDTEKFKEAVLSGVDLHGHAEHNYLLDDVITLTPANNGLTIDLRNAKVSWSGNSPIKDITGRDRGCFEFKGSFGSVIDSYTLTSALEEFSETYPTNELASIISQEFVKVNIGSLPLAAFDLILMPDKSSVGEVGLDYINGWEYPIGSVLTYTEVNAIKNCTIKNFEFIDLTTNVDPDDDITAVVFQIASNCHAENVSGTDTNNPVVFGQYCRQCGVNTGTLRDPKKPLDGGKGYFVQWNNSIYCQSESLRGIAVRHINDFTQSAFCGVKDCGGVNDKSGAFTTHGAYEHDLTYENINGVLTFANSGVAFGESTKRVTVTKAVGPILRARTNVIDLSVKDGYFDDIILNVVGLKLDNVNVTDSVNGQFQLNNWSRSLGKVEGDEPSKCSIEGGNIINNQSTKIFDQDLRITDSIYITNSDLTLDKSSEFFGGNIVLSKTKLTAANLSILQSTHANGIRVTLNDCTGDGFGVLFDGSANPITLKVNGGEYSGDNGSSAWVSVQDETGTAPVTIIVRGVEVDGDWTDIFEDTFSSGNGHNEKYTQIIRDNIFKNGAMRFTTNRNGEGAINYGGNITSNTTISTGIVGTNRVFESSAEYL